MKIYTKKGDDGTTGLLYGGRVAKDDARTSVYGTLDEAVAAMGVARAAGVVQEVEAIVTRLQREMFIVGAQLATSEENQGKLEKGVSRISSAETSSAEADIDRLLEKHPLRPEFVLPGETLGAAALDLARSIVRRAEREAVALSRSGSVGDDEVLRYLNRVSDLLFALARFEEAERGHTAPPFTRAVKPFLFCPSCGARLEGDANTESGARCPSCDRHWYRNSAPTAGAVIVRGGRALITERGVEPHKGEYDIPGGFLMAGEEPLDGLRRELKEELGDIEVEIGPAVQMVPHEYGKEGDYVLAIGFLAELLSGEPEAADDVASVRWVGPDEVDDVAFAWEHDRALVKRALEVDRGGG